MKNALINGLFLSFFMATFAYSAPTQTGTVSFGKGLNIATIPTDIADDESPDLCNCAPSIQGAMSKRWGSERYISQAISSQPVTSIYKAYTSTGTRVKSVLIASVADKLVISTGDTNPVWATISSNNVAGQHYSYVTMNGKVLIAGDAQTENVKSFNILTTSMSNLMAIDASTSGVNVRPKYHIVSKNWYIGWNVTVTTSATPLTGNTTSYPSRGYYSLLNNPSSMTAQRFIDFKTEDGDEVTGLGSANDAVQAFKGGSIGELTFTNLDLPSRGGDWVFREIVNGFGCIAPRTLVNTGAFYVMLSKDGIRTWNTGRASRVYSGDESTIISNKIKPLIDDLISSGRYKSSVMVYYPKANWLLFSYIDAKKFPADKNNSTLVYDFQTGEWFPFCNWLVDSYGVADNSNDTGQLYYGDSNDGYVHSVDLERRTDDSRKEIVLDTMDSTFTWKGSTQIVSSVIEGTGSLKVAVGELLTFTASSITKMGIIQLGEWYDKTKISKSDKLSFSVMPSSLNHLSFLRIDLAVNNNSVQDFDTNFTSVTLLPVNFTNGEGRFTTFEIQLSSFPVRPDWTALDSETIPFAASPTYYGIRFVVGGVDHASCTIDNLRVVQQTDNPVKMHRFTKLYSFGTIAQKGFGQVALTREKYATSNFFIDVYKDFGQVIRTFEAKAEIPKEVFVTGFSSGNNITVLNSVDYSVKRQTAAHENAWSAFNGALDRKFLYVSDRTNDRIFKMNRNDFSAIVSSAGQFGSGTTNFNYVAQQAIDDKSIFVADMNNQRIKQHNLEDLSFIKMAGSLGTQATSYNDVSGICANQTSVITSDESNARLSKLSKSTFGVLSQVAMDYNTIANTSLANDEKNVFVAYNKFSEVNSSFQDVILEKRDAGNLGLIQRVRVTPFDDVRLSTYNLMGEVAILGRYIYVIFTDSLQENTANYFLQKRLKSDLSVVSEYRTANVMYSVLGDGLSYAPALKNDRYDVTETGAYLQLKYYDDSLDNTWTLYNQTFLASQSNNTY